MAKRYFIKYSTKSFGDEQATYPDCEIEIVGVEQIRT